MCWCRCELEEDMVAMGELLAETMAELGLQQCRPGAP